MAHRGETDAEQKQDKSYEYECTGNGDAVTENGSNRNSSGHAGHRGRCGYNEEDDTRNAETAFAKFSVLSCLSG